MKLHLNVVAALIKDDGKVLICQRKKDDAFGLLWEFPGGKVESNETLEDALKREIKEELGTEIALEGLVRTFEDETDDLRITVHLFISKIVGGVPRAIECNDFQFVDVKRLEEFDLAPVDKKIFLFLKERRIAT